MTSGKRMNDEQLKNVTGGKGIIGMENYDTLLKKCPKCGGTEISQREFIADDGISRVSGQLCKCGFSWTTEK